MPSSVVSQTCLASMTSHALGLDTTDPTDAIAHFDGPLQVARGTGDTVVTPEPWFGGNHVVAHAGDEGLGLVEGAHVSDGFAGNGAPALADAIAESADWFATTLE